MHYLFIGLFVIYGAAIAILAVLLNNLIRHSERQAEWEMRHGNQYRKSSGSSDDYKSLKSRIENHDFQVKDLRDIIDGLNNRIKVLEDNLEVMSTKQESGIYLGQTEPDSRTKEASECVQTPPIHKPADGRIWVKQTDDGPRRLVEADTPGELFLLPAGKIYKLHISNLSKEPLYKLSSIYEHIIDFPAGYGTVSSVEMTEHPEYEKQNDIFILRKTGKIKVNQ